MVRSPHDHFSSAVSLLSNLFQADVLCNFLTGRCCFAWSHGRHNGRTAVKILPTHSRSYAIVHHKNDNTWDKIYQFHWDITTVIQFIYYSVCLQWNKRLNVGFISIALSVYIYIYGLFHHIQMRFSSFSLNLSVFMLQNNGVLSVHQFGAPLILAAIVKYSLRSNDFSLPPGIRTYLRTYVAVSIIVSMAFSSQW